MKHWQISHQYLKVYTLVSVNYLGNLNPSFVVRFELFMVHTVTETAYCAKETATCSETLVHVWQIMCQKMVILTCFIICRISRAPTSTDTVSAVYCAPPPPKFKIKEMNGS
jgi:hypothetical protein